MTLDEAWAAAEAALPDRWTFRHVTKSTGDEVRYVAVAMGPMVDICPTCSHADAREWINADGPTPAAALLALAARLLGLTA